MGRDTNETTKGKAVKGSMVIAAMVGAKVKTPPVAKKSPAAKAPPSVKGLAMAHGAVQSQDAPPKDKLPKGLQWVWHKPFEYRASNGLIVAVRGHWEKGKAAVNKVPKAKASPAAKAAPVVEAAPVVAAPVVEVAPVEVKVADATKTA